MGTLIPYNLVVMTATSHERHANLLQLIAVHVAFYSSSDTSYVLSYQKPAYLQIQRFLAFLELIYSNLDLWLFLSFFAHKKQKRKKKQK